MDECRIANDIDFDFDGGPLGFVTEFTLAVPAVLGMFLGAPLVAREIETGAGQLARQPPRRLIAGRAGDYLA